MLEIVTETTTKSHTFPPYFYDGDGLRISRTDNLAIPPKTTYYVWDTENPTGYPQVIEEIENNQVVRRYGYGLFLENIDIWNGTSFDRFYVVRDGTNSVRMLLDSTGNVSATYDYDAFGNLLSISNTNPLTSQNPYQFHSEYRDTTTGLIYLRARWYEPREGRFVGMDRYEGDNESPNTLNKYIFASNNAIDNFDTTGFMFEDMNASNSWSQSMEYLKGKRIKQLLGGYITDPDEIIKLIIENANKEPKIPLTVLGSLFYMESHFKPFAVGQNPNSTLDVGVGQKNIEYSQDPMTFDTTNAIVNKYYKADISVEECRDLLLEKRKNGLYYTKKGYVPYHGTKLTLLSGEWNMAVWGYKGYNPGGKILAERWKTKFFDKWPSAIEEGELLKLWKDNVE